MDRDGDGSRKRWNDRYGASDHVSAPARVLTQNLHLLPTSGDALDLACGLGANALLLAEHGLVTSAWDLSPVAIERLRVRAGSLGLRVDAEVRDIERHPPRPGTFDVIVVAHFLERTLAPAIAGALRPGGLLFYETFTQAAVSGRGPSNPLYRLASNELLRLFPDLIVRVYREEGRVGDLSQGSRDVALLVGQRRA